MRLEADHAGIVPSRRVPFLALRGDGPRSGERSPRPGKNFPYQCSGKRRYSPDVHQISNSRHRLRLWLSLRNRFIVSRRPVPQVRIATSLDETRTVFLDGKFTGPRSSVKCSDCAFRHSSHAVLPAFEPARSTTIITSRRCLLRFEKALAEYYRVYSRVDPAGCVRRRPAWKGTTNISYFDGAVRTALRRITDRDDAAFQVGARRGSRRRLRRSSTRWIAQCTGSRNSVRSRSTSRV